MAGSTETSSKPTSHGRRRAYILLIVLAFTALASSLGMSFLEANSTVMPEAVNYSGTVRAEVLASSGIAMASHYLLYPPTTVDLFSYYTGASGATIDSSGDYFDVSVSRSDKWSPPKTDLNLYRLIATGVAKDPSGAIRAKRSITAEIQAPPIGKWQFTQALWSNSTLYVPSQAFVTGDLHTNGNLTGNGSCTGAISASGTAIWTGSGPPKSVVSLASAISAPTIAPYQAAKYTIRGVMYSTYFLNKNDLSQSDTDALNAIDMSATNPGRIIILKDGNAKLHKDTNVNGTIVVNGRLEFEESGSRSITAVAGFPALVVTGDIRVNNNDSITTVTGSILCGGIMDTNSKDRSSITVTGTCLAVGGLDIPKPTSSQVFNWSATWSVFWDIQNVPPAPQPMTILDWKEN